MVKEENKRLFILMIVFTGIMAAIFIVNRWISREMANSTKSLPVKKHVPPAAAVPAAPTARPRPVVIDPINDPLAPVVRQKEPKASLKTTAPPPPAREKVYEPSLDTDTLVQ